MNIKKIFAALLTIIGSGGLFIAYGIIAIFFFFCSIDLVFNTRQQH